MNDWRNIDLASEGLPDAVHASRKNASGAMFGIESIHGDDDRQWVRNTMKYPASAICHLLVEDASGATWGATGAFITPTSVLTAGHAVFVRSGTASHGRVRRIVVVPGRNGTGKPPFGAAEAHDWYAPASWSDDGLPEADYGIIRVPPANAVGTFRPVALPDEKLLGLSVLIAGYPDDKPPGTQWHDKRTIAGVVPGQVAYDIDTEIGQSGSAVFTYQEGRAFVVAIHRYGNEHANFGTRITTGVLADIRAHL